MNDITHNGSRTGRGGWFAPALVAVILLIIGWRGWFLYQGSQLRYLRVAVRAPASDQAQLYYDRGFGFNEHDSNVARAIKDDRLPWGVFSRFGAPSRQWYCFQLPSAVIGAFRLGPYPAGGGMVVHVTGMEVIDGLGNPLRMITANPSRAFTFAAPDVGERKVVDFTLRSPVRIEAGRFFLKQGTITRILLELLIIFAIVVVIQVFKHRITAIAPDSVKRKSFCWFEQWIHGWVFFVFLSVVFICGYYRFSTKVSSVLFGKAIFFIILILNIIFFLRNYETINKIRTVAWLHLIYLILISISFVVHYFAENSVGILNYISFVDLGNNNVNNAIYKGVLFDKYGGIHNMFRFHSLFMYIFPFLFFAALSFLVRDHSGWKKLTLIPLLFVPSMLLALYQHYIDVQFMQNWPTDHLMHGLGTSFVSLRITLFLAFPLAVLGLATARQWWKKSLFILSLGLILWLMYLTFGRGAILGTFIFLVLAPMIRCWVYGRQGDVKRAVMATAAVAALGVTVLLAGFASPRYHDVIERSVFDRSVATVNALLTGDLDDASVATRVEMSRQAWRLFMEAPMSGWGPAAFRNNSARIRFVNSDNPNIGHDINYYLQIGTSFGMLGMGVALLLHLMPLWMIFRVQKRIESHEERWAAGIVFTMVVIMLLLFMTNPNVNYPESNWIYSLCLAFLVSVAVRHGYRFAGQKRLFVLGGVLLLLTFTAGTYSTTFGANGYRNTVAMLMQRITSGYSPGKDKVLYNSRETKGMMHATINPMGGLYRRKYSTNVFSMRAASAPFAMRPDSDIFCLKASVDQPGSRDRLFLTLKIKLNGQVVNKHVFHMQGEKMLYFRLPRHAMDKDAVIQIDADMWWLMPYHEDARTWLHQKEYMPDHPDYRDFGVTVSVIPYKKIADAANREKT